MSAQSLKAKPLERSCEDPLLTWALKDAQARSCLGFPTFSFSVLPGVPARARQRERLAGPGECLGKHLYVEPGGPQTPLAT